ncbi:MAG: acyltransferase [Planctomycetota bacterium]|nr:MAG: acyltransferase [Planctomycetota bacterium]
MGTDAPPPSPTRAEQASTPLREALKALARGLALLAVLPLLLSYALRSLVLGRDRALEGSTQALALIPGLPGQYLRRAFLSRTLAYCGPDATIEFGTLFSKAGARIEDRAYVGPRCQLGLVHIGADALLAAGVHVPSGAHIHGTERLDVPIRNQPGRAEVVRIGAGAWIGSAAVVMADVGRDTIVGAGAVVTRPLPDRVIAGGVPARVIRERRAHDAPSPEHA